MSLFGPIYDADKMFGVLDELAKANERAIAEMREHLPWEKCYRCGGAKRQARSIFEAVGNMPLGNNCPDCLGTGVNMRVPFDMKADTWVRLVLRAWDEEMLLSNEVRTAVIVLLAALNRQDDLDAVPDQAEQENA